MKDIKVVLAIACNVEDAAGKQVFSSSFSKFDYATFLKDQRYRKIDVVGILSSRRQWIKVLEHNTKMKTISMCVVW